ncbi:MULTISPECIES: SDR family NAD(P)-dependent oxidoreductase [unclassified Chelatococcus]|uniref:SDR family NAD(P)-dependent oxidoreductase n=1 Tax=unclassified Chelatococcus TaxID=2638111 RepID=UPI001BCFC5AE|nr:MULTISPECIES: SDR family NAD(P)-dependent oxidoreductase [unclassified Chelatococcus]MBS7700044.1 SDR family NAD(P)-dependent oxidoreductase [Chelatococcus sp. YT9]MBX3556737.1 SDR family NAD(P)-dependent oxidoreductase [Chelatococcus sp.]
MNMSVATRPVVITGGAGFIGSNLADRLARDGHHVLIFDSLARPGVERNVAWLAARHGPAVSLMREDIRDERAVAAALAQARAVFHLAAQVAVTSSLVDPREDFAINLAGTLNVLEALRARREPVPLVFASTNKVYGDLADVSLADEGGAYRPVDTGLRANGIDENRPLDFHTPYGCSKGAADQYVLDYSRNFGLPTAVLRMSCIYGPRQLGTEDQGWVAHFMIRALRDTPITIYGDGHQVRDVLYIDDAVEAYVRSWQSLSRPGSPISGRAFNLGGGPANAVSLLQLTSRMESMLGRPVTLNFQDWRAGDQHYFVADTRRLTEQLALPTPRPWRVGLERLAAWLDAEHAPVAAPQQVARV